MAAIANPWAAAACELWYIIAKENAGCVGMHDRFVAVKACVGQAVCALQGMALAPEYRWKLHKDILSDHAGSPLIQELKRQVLTGPMVAEVAAEQLRHGGWARFGTEDLTVKKRVPTTMFAVRRLVWLGLDKEDAPLAGAMEYLIDLLEGRRTPPEGGEVNERWPEVLRIRAATFIAMIDPYAACLDDLLARWRFIAENTFHSGAYNYDACRELQSMLLNVQGPRLIPLPLQLLVCRPGFLSEELERMLLLYCWQRHLEGFLLWPEGKLNDLADAFRHPHTSRKLNTMESMACFRGSRLVLEPSIEWLLASRDADGLWDYGPQAKDPAGYPRRLAAMDWRKPINRKLDCTMEVLMLLKQYLGSNLVR